MHCQFLRRSSNSLSSLRFCRASCISLWLPKTAITTVHFLTGFNAAFSRDRIDIGSVQNMYQVDFLFSLESHQIDLICTSDRKWYDYIKFLLEEENKWKNFFFAPLSILYYHCTAIIFDFQNAVTVFSSEFLFLNLQLSIFLLIFYFE